MNVNDRFEELGNNFQSVVNRMMFILEKSPTLPSEEQMLMLSILELIGLCIVGIGDAMETGNEYTLNKAFDSADKVYLQAMTIVEKHPQIKAASEWVLV